jgi:hypothetical protein
MLVLRQSTSVDIRVGPFLDATDGVTPETGITLAGADQAEVLKANGAATTAMAGTFAAVTGADGWYDYTVATGDVDTVGEVCFVVQDSSVCLPVFVRAQVVEETVYDALFASSAAGFASISALATVDSNVDSILTDTGTTIPAQISGLNNVSSADVNAACDTAIADASLATASALATVDANVDAILVDTAEIGAAGAGLTAVPWNASWDAEVQSECTDALNAYDPPTRAELTSDIAGLNDLSAAEVSDALSAYNAVATTDLPTNFGDLAITATTGLVDINTNNDKTGYTISGTITTLDALDTAQDTQHTTTQSAISTAQSDINTIKAGIIEGQAQTGTLTTTQFSTNLTGYTDDQLIGRVVIFTGGDADGEVKAITDYASSSGLITVGSALTTAPANTDSFKIV